ncbi:hypothetical protein J0S82_015549, partial [Galemys pyrenaicus]
LGPPYGVAECPGWYSQERQCCREEEVTLVSRMDHEGTKQKHTGGKYWTSFSRNIYLSGQTKAKAKA